MAGAASVDRSGRQRLRLAAALLAIVAVVFNGFAPGLHRLAMAHAADAAALCTSEGPVTAHPAPHPAPHPDGGAPPPFAAGDCCGLCILGGAALVAASVAAAALPMLAARTDRPAGSSPALRRAPTGPPLPARGPPFS